MGATSPASHELMLAIGLGVAACSVVYGVAQMLFYAKEASIVPPAQNQPSYITQDVEDSLKVSTLDKLLESPNFCIQETTAIIICERALHDGASVDMLLWQIAQADHALREQSIRALSMMINSSTVKIINKPGAYAALVQSLEYSVADYRHNVFDLEWDNWHLRDVAEQGCLMILAQLVDKFGVEGIVKAGFVERWLAKEPWAETEEARMSFFLESLRKHQRLTVITMPLFRDRAGRKRLIKVKLMPPEVESESERHKDTRMINGESTAGEENENSSSSNEGLRRREQSAEDDQIRRRHREAMVLNDGTRPLARGDIIQRDSSFSH